MILKKLNNYLSYYATTEDDVHGIFYLDSNRKAVSFKSYKELEKESEMDNGRSETED